MACIFQLITITCDEQMSRRTNDRLPVKSRGRIQIQEKICSQCKTFLKIQILLEFCLNCEISLQFAHFILDLGICLRYYQVPLNRVKLALV